VIVKRWISLPTIAPNAGTRWAAYNAVPSMSTTTVRSAAATTTPRALRAVTIGSTAQAMKANAFRILQTL
jgi:hypothetical protein